MMYKVCVLGYCGTLQAAAVQIGAGHVPLWKLRTIRNVFFSSWTVFATTAVPLLASILQCIERRKSVMY